MATPPDSWDQIVEHALSREVHGELSEHFAARVVQRVERTGQEREERWAWLWWAGMSLLAVILIGAHVGLAVSDYRDAFTSVLRMARSFRLDLMIAVLISVALWETAGRRIRWQPPSGR